MSALALWHMCYIHITQGSPVSPACWITGSCIKILRLSIIGLVLTSDAYCMQTEPVLVTAELHV